MQPIKSSVILILLFLSACKNKPDIEKEKNAILHLHEEQRKAHLEKNVSLLVAQFSPDFMVINHGSVSKPSVPESIKSFQTYFDAVDFVKWDDIQPPVIRFSDDASMATALVEKLVITKQKMKNNLPDTTYYAWLSVYKKYKGEWKLDEMVSTNK